MERPQMRIETAAVHAGHVIDPATGAVAAPIHLSTTFARDAAGDYSRGFSYARENNPNRVEVERSLAALEGGACAVAFASGLAAADAVFRSLRPGDHVVAPREIYHGVRTQLETLHRSWGLAVSYAPMHEPARVREACTDHTCLVWVETPANPMLQVSDIAALAAIAHDAGALLACDNTFATPILQRPIEHGADLVMHATTKWIGGHSDLTGGVVVCRSDDETAERLRRAQRIGGSAPGPFDCWLAARGARSLACRVRASTASAAQIAAHFDGHEKIERVLYPGLSGSAGHEIARRQMDGFGGIVSLCVRAERDAAMAVARRTKIFTNATSLGGVESLIEHRESIEGSATTTPANLLRLSIGLEHADDLIADLEQALEG
ncbi:MAG: trans-sulfuration enzyme family protein [Phycisphaerales bacterium]